MADMIKFFKGLEASLPASGVNGALYITTDEGAIYLGTGTGMKRLGDFVQVANVASLPEKAHENCLYYCVAENILAKWNGSEWKQVNKQPTVEEMKTLLGLGSLAYKSEVVEGDLNSDLAAKINAASGAQHGHDNKDVIDGITAEKVSAWDAAEGNAKTYADGLNTAMNTRVEALEAIDHEHANKALLDTYTQTEADLADAVAKKHSHTFVESELNKIADGDVAKWNAVVADHLDSEDLAALENSIKEAKKAGTDANTNIEAYKVTNDARVLAVEEDIAEIVNGENGILAQAKSYSDGKLATAKTEISAEIDADVKVVADDLAGYKTSNDAALAGVKATAEAAATKEYTDAELAKKVDKDTYAADKATFAIAETVNAALDLKANAADVVANDTFESFKTANTQAIADAKAGAVSEVEAKGYAVATEVASTYATKTELGNVDKKFENYVTSASYATDKAAIEKAIEDEGKARSEADAGFEARIADLEANFGDGDGTVEAQIAAAVKAEEDARKEAIQGVQGEIADVDAKFADYTKTADLPTDLGDFTNNAGYAKTADVNAELDKKADKTQVATDIANAIAPLATTEALNGVDAKFANYTNTTDMNAKFELKADKTALEATDKTLADVKAVVDNFFAEDAAVNDTIDTLKEIAAYIATDKEGAADITARVGVLEGKVDVEKVTTAIADAVKAETDRATEAEGVLAGRLDTLEAIDHDAYKAADTALHTVISKEIDDDVKAAIDAEVLRADAAYDTKGDAAKAQAAAEAKAAELDAALKTELQGEIDADVKVVADDLAGYKTSNDAEVAKKANSADVYAKTETFTKDEVNAAIAAAIEAAHTWGEF